MKYTDTIYGTFQIDDPVIIDLIASKPLQRLKDVNQYGASFLRFPHLTTSRFEHSVGVYYLLRRFNASLLEQISGLLHDVPHTAFSHVSDVVFEDTTQTFHEKLQEKVFFESKIPQILKKHGFSIWKLLNREVFTLAEQELPDLCADRIDYFFRDCVVDKQLAVEDARKMLDDLVVHDGLIAFQTPELAKQCTVTYRTANEKLWAHPLQSALYYLLASALKLALEEGIVSFDDLFTTDQAVHEKMKKSGHKEILKYLNDMEHLAVEESAGDYDYHVQPKIRVVDPWVLSADGLMKRISELDIEIKKDNQEFLDRMSKGYYVKVL